MNLNISFKMNVNLQENYIVLVKKEKKVVEINVKKKK